jgi:5'-deoxynucleotidase YfbR-like HD superfamily hydrolase
MSKLPFSLLQRVQQELILPFYGIERATPLPKKLGGRHENDAEHSWSLALLACAAAPHIDPQLDIGKVAQFAIVHDLLEVYSGDTPNFAPDHEKASKDKREEQAMAQLKSAFHAMPWIIDTVAEYEAQDSPEAHFVRSLDKTLSLMQEHASEGQIFRDFKITEELFKKKLEGHRRKAGIHPGAFAYYEEAWDLLLANPHFFHKESK